MGICDDLSVNKDMLYEHAFMFSSMCIRLYGMFSKLT